MTIIKAITAGFKGPPTTPFIFYFSLMIDMPTILRLSCRALLMIVLVRPNFYLAGPQASHQPNPAPEAIFGSPGAFGLEVTAVEN